MKDIARRLIQRAPLKLRRQAHFLKAHHRLPNLRRPRTFSEKVNWRILRDRRDLISWTCDKLEMKSYASASGAGVEVPKTLWTGTDVSELERFDFPERWILKANHRSQCVYPGVGQPELSTLREATSGWLDNWQAEQLGEWAYSKATPLIMLEEWIGDGPDAPSDYKFFVFAGRVEMIQLDVNRFSGHEVRLYNRDWHPLGASKGLWKDAAVIPAPENLHEMIQIAESLGSPFDFMRIDLFSTSRGVYFGETTPYPGGGLSPFSPRAFDLELGMKWLLPDDSARSSVSPRDAK